MKKITEISKKEVLKNNPEKYANFEAQKYTCKKSSKSKIYFEIFPIDLILSNFFSNFRFLGNKIRQIYKENIFAISISSIHTLCNTKGVANCRTPPVGVDIG